MLRFGKIRTCPAASAAAAGGRAADVYDCHSAALYNQALLTVGDAALAEQVVCAVIVDECRRSPDDSRDQDEAGSRMALSVYARCRELASAPERRGEIPAGRESGTPAARIVSSGLPDARERGMLALVVFGGLGYAQASRGVGASPRETAVLLRDALRSLTIPAGRSS